MTGDAAENGSGMEENETAMTQKEEYPGRTKVNPAQITYADSYQFDKLTYDGLEEAEFSCLLEAEEAETGEGVTLKTDKAGFSGTGYVDISDNTKFSLTVTLPVSHRSL